MRAKWFCGAALVGLVLAVPAAAQDNDEVRTSPAEKIRKALDQKMAIDHTSNSLQESLDFLRQKTKVNFVIDQFVLQQFGFMIPGMNGFGGGIAVGPDGNPIQQQAQAQVRLKGDRPRTALQSMLGTNGLAYVILGEQVVITTEEYAGIRQLRQRITVDAQSMPLVKLLQKISGDTAAAIVIDPRNAKDALTPVNLKLDDTSLETAVRLASELAGLKAVRMGDVLFVTDETRAEKIRKENEQQNQQRFNGINGPMGGLQVPPIFGGRVGGGFGGAGIAVPGIAVPALPPQAVPGPARDAVPMIDVAPPRREAPPAPPQGGNSTAPAPRP